MQRRHQKIIEIAPAVFISATLRQKLHNFALKIARNVRYGMKNMLQNPVLKALKLADYGNIKCWNCGVPG